MARPADWTPLADADPVPGDPVKVGELSSRYRETATTISEQAAALRRLCTDNYWDSGAGLEFRNRSEELAGKLDDAFARYDAAATALRDYRPELDEAQRAADAALATAREAARVHQEQVSAAEQAAAAAQSAPSASSDPLADQAGPPPATVPAVPSEPDLGPARSQLAEALRIRDEAARTAANAIGRVIDGDDVKDSWGDKFKGWVQDNADVLGAISTWAGRVAIVCGTLSLLVGWIPIVGQVAATVLGTVALVATAVSLVCNVMLAVAGEGSWLAVGLDVVGLLSFGIGRAAITGGLAAARGVRGLASQSVLAAGRRAGGALPAGSRLNRLYNAAKRGSVGLTPHQARLAREAIPTGPVPSVGQVAGGLNPVRVADDIRTGATSAAADFRIWRAGGLGDQGLTWPKPWRGEAGLANEIALAREAATRVPGVAAEAPRLLSQAVGAQRTWFASNLAGVVPATADQFGAFNDLKPPTTAGVPLP